MTTITNVKKKGLCALFLLFFLFLYQSGVAQTPLNRIVTLEVNRQQLAHVLEILSNKANFYFSYNSNILRKDSLVTFNVQSRSVGYILNTLFNEGYEFKESGNYIIIRRRPIQVPLVTTQTVSEESQYYVSGYIFDDQTGDRVVNASVFEKDQLAYAQTNTDGFFKLKLKGKYKQASITVSKQYYEDTTITVRPKYNQQLSITIMPVEISDQTTIIGPYTFQAPDSIVVAVHGPDSTHWLYTYRKTDSVMVEKTSMGKFLLSTMQQIQTLNLRKFFTVRPYQVSFVPGMSSNGKLNSQVINNFSFNILGGYSGGVNGFELGGLFNIDKKDVRFVQIGGLLNIDGASFNGVQIGGIHNTVLDSVNGFQVGGIGNFVKRNVKGWQIGGIYNHTGGTFKGAQLSGFANFVGKAFSGMQGSGNYNVAGNAFTGAQIAGWGNFSRGYTLGAQLAGNVNVNWKDMKGAQISGLLNLNGRHMQGAQVSGLGNVNGGTLNGIQVSSILNYTKKLKGVQIGLVNIADTSDGYSIGLINIIFKGYHKLSLFTNDAMPFNGAFKTGNSKLYSILLASVSVGYGNDTLDKAWGFGYGIGREFPIAKKWAFNTEITSQHIYLGDWEHLNLLNRLSFHAHFKLGKYVSLFAGPAFSLYYSDQDVKHDGFKTDIAPSGHFKFGDKMKGWFGFNAGIDFF
ncbi:MAG: LA_2272 family surface repeat-containing protein [Pseudobacter sp.]|uniref:LA_2272 family surface repeat-containing protein n=1 Tax=Pseudobacter sp. TaxID=2045420 RepID=UPI003F809E89